MKPNGVPGEWSGWSQWRSAGWGGGHAVAMVFLCAFAWLVTTTPVVSGGDRVAMSQPVPAGEPPERPPVGALLPSSNAEWQDRGTADVPDLGKVYLWFIVGGSSPNWEYPRQPWAERPTFPDGPNPLQLNQAALSGGLDDFAEAIAPIVREYRPDGVILHNPHGAPAGPTNMAFEARALARDIGLVDVASELQTIRCVEILQEALGPEGVVWAYLGDVGRGRAMSDAAIEYAVSPWLAAGAGVVLDTAGDERAGSSYWRVAEWIQEAGGRVGIEPRPQRGTPWGSAEFTVFAVSDARFDPEDPNRYLVNDDGVPAYSGGYLRNDPERYNDAGGLRESEIDGEVVLLVRNMARRGFRGQDFPAGLVARGYSVGVPGYGAVRNHGRASVLYQRAHEYREHWYGVPSPMDPNGGW